MSTLLAATRHTDRNRAPNGLEDFLNTFSSADDAAHLCRLGYFWPHKINGVPVWFVVRHALDNPSDHQLYLVWQDNDNNWRAVGVLHSEEACIACTDIQGWQESDETNIYIGVSFFSQAAPHHHQGHNHSITVQVPKLPVSEAAVCA